MRFCCSAPPASVASTGSGRSPLRTTDAPVPVAPPAGSRQLLDELGPERFAQWMLKQERVLVTDTTMRDAHQSLLATRLRGYDMLRIAPYYAQLLPQMFSLECWGGATFDVAMRFLREDPWERLERLRERDEGLRQLGRQALAKR